MLNLKTIVAGLVLSGSSAVIKEKTADRSQSMRLISSVSTPNKYSSIKLPIISKTPKINLEKESTFHNKFGIASSALVLISGLSLLMRNTVKRSTLIIWGVNNALVFSTALASGDKSFLTSQSTMIVLAAANLLYAFKRRSENFSNLDKKCLLAAGIGWGLFLTSKTFAGTSNLPYLMNGTAMIASTAVALLGALPSLLRKTSELKLNLEQYKATKLAKYVFATFTLNRILTLFSISSFDFFTTTSTSIILIINLSLFIKALKEYNFLDKQITKSVK